MRIKLDRASRVALLKALKTGYLETDDVSGMPSEKLTVEVVEAKDEIKRLEELNDELRRRGYEA